MKKYAIYLPQFHEIPENNEWWGKGFTEWTNVKKAEPLFSGHKQPKVPADDNYYCLDNAKTLEWQAKLAHQYGIDGMIFYHYYFCGKKLLEKPAEILLKHADIGLNFFFCWANHSWYRTWEGSKTMLMEQVYGGYKEWEEHFEYLLPFFKDQRYEKKDNMPVFMVFKPFFDEKKEMFEFFNQKCIEQGFNGIYVIETCTEYNDNIINNLLNEECKYNKNIYLREPDAALVEVKKSFKFFVFRIKEKISRELKLSNSSPIQRINAKWLYNIMIRKRYGNIIRGVFFEWDNTPRHGKRGYIINSIDKSTFFIFMDSLKDNEYLIINAWNEWCEGMMLEPTVENGYKYLEWIKEWSDLK